MGRPAGIQDVFGLFARAAAVVAITAARVQKLVGARAKAVERKKRNRKRVKAKDLVIG